MYWLAKALAGFAARAGPPSLTVMERMFVFGLDTLRTDASPRGWLICRCTRRATVGEDTSSASVAACRVGSMPGTPAPATVDGRLSVCRRSRADDSYFFVCVLVY